MAETLTIVSGPSAHARPDAALDHPIGSMIRSAGTPRPTPSGAATGRWRCAGARLAWWKRPNSFRRVNGHLSKLPKLPKLPVTLERQFRETVTPAPLKYTKDAP
jgi:hypothetical protein